MGLKLGEEFQGITEGEGQPDPPTVQMEAVDPGQQGWPVLAECFGEGGQLGPGGMQPGQIVEREGVLFNRHEIQGVRAGGIIAPGLPGGEEVQPQAEAGLDDDPALPASPAFRQIVAAKKDVAGLPEAAGAGVVDIVEDRGVGRPVGGEGQNGGLNRWRHGIARGAACRWAGWIGCGFSPKETNLGAKKRCRGGTG